MSGHLEQIRTFLAVADAQGFSPAAKALGTSPSTVTRAVAELEARLGVQLLVRTTRKVALTQAGQDYRARMAPLVADLDAAEDRARTHQTSLTGQIRVSAPLSFGMHFLARPLATFRDAYPGIDIALTLTDRFVDILTEDYDMALRISGAPSDVSTIWRKIRLVPRSLIASPAYLAAHGTPATPADLSGHQCLSYTLMAEGETWALTDPATGDTQPVRVPFRFACNNGDLLAQLACADQGIALLPDFLVADEIAAGRLVRVLPRWRAPDIWLTAYFPPYQKLPATLQRFTDTIEEAVSDLTL